MKTRKRKRERKREAEIAFHVAFHVIYGWAGQLALGFTIAESFNPSLSIPPTLTRLPPHSPEKLVAVAVCMTSLIMLQARSKPFPSQSRPSELSLGRWENIPFYARKRAQPGVLCLGVRLGPVVSWRLMPLASWRAHLTFLSRFRLPTS